MSNLCQDCHPEPQSRDPDAEALRFRIGILRLGFGQNDKLYLLLPPSPFQNEPIARFVFRPRFKSFRQLSPRAHRMMSATAAFGFPLAPAHWMIDWIHRHAPHVRASSLPARPACFATRHVHVIDVADLTNRRVTGLMNAPDLTRWHFHQTVAAFAVIQR